MRKSDMELGGAVGASGNTAIVSDRLAALLERPINAVSDAVASLVRTHGPLLADALRVRAVETTLLTLFKEGKLHGTVHTCLGQELIGIFVGRHLKTGDFVTSNHRCHGHFIGATGNWRGLIDELVGNAEGVCGGVGGSQHLYAQNFLSNGQQGGLLPVAAGIALDHKLRGSNGLVVSFIGEGTLGEGIVYEVLNLGSLWKLPLVVVCENNFYSQSTPQKDGLAGDIAARAQAFGWHVCKGDVWAASDLDQTIADAMQKARSGGGPVFVHVETYRLAAHSKGDDTRDTKEIAAFTARDPLNVLMQNWAGHCANYEAILNEVSAYAELAVSKPAMPLARYVGEEKEVAPLRWHPPPPENALRIGQGLNGFYGEFMATEPRACFLGEDITDPYGGAFKVTKGLQARFPERFFSTPISEAAIVGAGIGLAMTGNRPVVEIMFGDFLGYAFDQLLNNASKFGRMYGRKLACPLVVRAPMGGRRGYGPTHSQSLERHFVGMDGCVAVSLHSLLPAETQLGAIARLEDPLLLFENKVAYANDLFTAPAGYIVECTDGDFPAVAVRPNAQDADITIAAYGGAARFVADRLVPILEACDVIPELIILGQIYPLDVRPVLASVAVTGKLLVVEEGSAFAGIGSEIIAEVVARQPSLRATKIGRRPVPIPAVPTLEELVLPDMAAICTAIRSLLGNQ